MGPGKTTFLAVNYANPMIRPLALVGCPGPIPLPKQDEGTDAGRQLGPWLSCTDPKFALPRLSGKFVPVPWEWCHQFGVAVVGQGWQSASRVRPPTQRETAVYP